MTAWVSVADVQEWIGPDVDETTAAIVADNATSSLRDALERDLSQQTLTELYDSNNTDYILLSSWPVVSLTSVSIDGLPPIPPAALHQRGWRIDRVVPRKLQFAGYGRIARGYSNISVTYVAGYPIGTPPDSASSPSVAGTGLPPSIYLALKLTAAAIYNAAAADPNLASESVAGVFNASFYPSGVGAVPPGAISLIRPYKRIAP